MKEGEDRRGESLASHPGKFSAGGHVISYIHSSQQS